MAGNRSLPGQCRFTLSVSTPNTLIGIESLRYRASGKYAPMDYETLKWIRVIHLCGMLAWVGGLIGLSFVLRAHANADKAAHDTMVSLEKGIAMVMDIGATIAIALGLTMLFTITPTLLKGNGGWMHTKLLLVVILIGLHGVQRMRVGKNKRGNVSAEPGWMIPTLGIVIIATIIMASGRPF